MNPTLAERLAAWASTLELGDVPPRVVAYAKSQVVSQLAAARAGLASPLGERLVRAFGPPLQPASPKEAAFVLAALTMCLDFDDTMYAGHVSHSTVGVPLSYAGPLCLDGTSVLTAIVAANECAARITAAATLGELRGQTAAHAHLAGSVAARLRAEGAPAERWVDAWGIAFAMPPLPLRRAFMGSDAKSLTASAAVRAGLGACDAAAAGLGGAPDIFEHPEGFLARFASVPLPEAMTWGLGTRWHTETLSFKVHPCCAYVDAAIDCAVALHARLPDLDPADVGQVRVHASAFTVGMELASAPFVAGPASPVSALNFSTGYNVATALLTGDLVPGDLAGAPLADTRRWELAGKVTVLHDWDLTRRAVLATAPLGEALRHAGGRAAGWLREIGGDEAAALAAQAGEPVQSFEHADKAMAARVEVRMADGRVLSEARDIARGAAGPETRAGHAGIVRAKLLGCGGTEEVADGLGELERLGAPEVSSLLAAALAPAPAG